MLSYLEYSKQSMLNKICYNFLGHNNKFMIIHKKSFRDLKVYLCLKSIIFLDLKKNSNFK